MKRMESQEVDEQVQVAARMFEHDRRLVEEAKRRQAAADAAQEMGIPAEYMERAADQIRARNTRRRRQRFGYAGLAAALSVLAALGGAYRVTHHPPPPLVYDFSSDSQGQWRMETFGRADLSFHTEPGHGHVTVIKIAEFNSSAPVADLVTNQIPEPLTQYQAVSFSVRGTKLQQIRLFLERGNERWVSPFLTVSSRWQSRHVPLSHFLHQTRSSDMYNWQDAPPSRPGAVGKLSFKLGSDANFLNGTNPTAQDGCETDISNLRFE